MGTSPEASGQLLHALTVLALAVHIGGGAIGLVSGTVAVFARKGGYLHRKAGTVFGHHRMDHCPPNREFLGIIREVGADRCSRSLHAICNLDVSIGDGASCLFLDRDGFQKPQVSKNRPDIKPSIRWRW